MFFCAAFSAKMVISAAFCLSLRTTAARAISALAAARQQARHLTATATLPPRCTENYCPRSSHGRDTTALPQLFPFNWKWKQQVLFFQAPELQQQQQRQWQHTFVGGGRGGLESGVSGDCAAGSSLLSRASGLLREERCSSTCSRRFVFSSASADVHKRQDQLFSAVPSRAFLSRFPTTQTTCIVPAVGQLQQHQQHAQQRGQQALQQQQILFLSRAAQNLQSSSTKRHSNNSRTADAASGRREARARITTTAPLCRGQTTTPGGAATAAPKAEESIVAGTLPSGFSAGTHLIKYNIALNSAFRPQPPQRQPHRQYQQTKRAHSSAMEKQAEPLVPYDADNVFKKIIAGKIPCHKIFETEHVLAILDAFPAVAGHSLLIQKKEVASIFDMDEETAAAVFRELPRLCRAVQKATNCDGINVLQNNGRAAGQVVFHAHVHVVPRFEKDRLFQQFASSKEMIGSTDAQEMVEKIRSHL